MAAGTFWYHTKPVGRGEQNWHLSGGTQMILSQSERDGTNVSQEQLKQAVEIIRQRVDGAGVSEAEVSVLRL